MFEINYGSLDKLRPLIEQAKDMEKSIHQKKQDEKAANWIVQNAIDGDYLGSNSAAVDKQFKCCVCLQQA